MDLRCLQRDSLDSLSQVLTQGCGSKCKKSGMGVQIPDTGAGPNLRKTAGQVEVTPWQRSLQWRFVVPTVNRHTILIDQDKCQG